MMAGIKSYIFTFSNSYFNFLVRTQMFRAMSFTITYSSYAKNTLFTGLRTHGAKFLPEWLAETQGLFSCRCGIQAVDVINNAASKAILITFVLLIIILFICILYLKDYSKRKGFSKYIPCQSQLFECHYSLL